MAFWQQTDRANGCPPSGKQRQLRRARGTRSPVFSRTFYRNAINNGLVPIECETAHIREGDRLTIQLGGPAVTVADVSTGQTVAGAALTGIMLEILESGGLVPYLRRAGQFHV